MKKGIQIIRQHTDREELDYTYVMDCLKKFAAPRAKMTRLLKEKSLIRVKKGIYVFGEEYRRRFYSLEILANKIYGPSYISLEFALAYYGMIPEHVFQVTSVTSKRKRDYTTPVGYFTYTPLPLSLYKVGFTLREVGQSRFALMATREKALADLFYVKKPKIETFKELEELLFEDLRLDETEVPLLDVPLLEEIEKAHKNPPLSLLIQYLKETK